MNINVKVGQKAWMTGTALITALVAAACGNDTRAVPPQTYEIVPGTYQGTVESFWAEKAGPEISKPEFLAGLDLDGPFYGPSATAGNFDVMGRVGTKCVAVFEAGMGDTGDPAAFGTILYVGQGGKLVPWAARSSSEADAAGANRLIAHFGTQCV